MCVCVSGTDVSNIKTLTQRHLVNISRFEILDDDIITNPDIFRRRRRKPWGSGGGRSQAKLHFLFLVDPVLSGELRAETFCPETFQQ